MQAPARFSSCRGVAFEIKPHADPFAINPAPTPPQPQSKRFGFPWGFFENPSRVFHDAYIRRSMSRTSSHFCDVEPDVGDDEDLYSKDVGYYALEMVEEGKKTIQEDKEEKPIIPMPSKPERSDDQKQREEKPGKTGKQGRSRLSIILFDQGLFTVYKRLFLICFALNITGLTLAATGGFPYARNRAALFSIGNIFALILCRSEAFLRLVFFLAVKALGKPWIPLHIKTAVTALLQSLGGIHSGCGVSSIAWLIYALVLALQDRGNTSSEIIGMASAILSLLFLSSLAAFPLIRHLHHNAFERTHRFAGWAALGLLWAYVFLNLSYDPKTNTYSRNLSSRFPRSQEFWLTLGITILIILPWLTVRRVAVKTSSPSDHASIIKFEGGVAPGLLGRISPSPLSEWHAFGIISDGKKDHMMLAGAVGDFTKSLVSNPPSHLWVRTVHFAGLPYLVNMYGRVLLVATGSGICVFLSFLLQVCRAEVCLLWVAKGIEQNFGAEIKEMVNDSNHKDGNDKMIIVHDTALLGRPNVSQMTVETARKFGAEVVIVTSNPEGSRDIVNACKAQGLPAFGPIWDS